MMVKVCGMRDPDNVKAVAEQGPGLMGFIFYEKSPRAVVSTDATMPLADFPAIKRVGVFVNPELEEVLLKARSFGLDYVQLHGDESPGFCATVRGFVPVIKAFRIAEQNDFAHVNAYAEAADLFLFDAKGRGYGGNGIQFDWKLIQGYEGKTPFLLSGGIGPQNLDALREFQHPQWVGIDVNSGFETEPGRKDDSVLGPFIAAITSLYKNDSILKR